MSWYLGLIRFARRVMSRFVRDACPGRAAGLAFNTIFAVVPLTAVVVGFLGAFGLLDSAGGSPPALLEQLVPAASDRLFAAVAEFSANARTLGLLGVLVFLVTAVLLVRGVHGSLNAIWRFPARSGFWRRVSTYTTVIVFGIVLLALAVAAGPLVQSIVGDGSPGWLDAVGRVVIPPSLMFATIWLTIVLVPSGRVDPRSAAIGAAGAAVTWEVAKQLFVVWTGSFMRLNVIYGSLAAVPLFLIWVYITWTFVLAGAEIAYVHQHRETLAAEEAAGEEAAALPLLSELSAGALLEVLVRFRDGRPPLSRATLGERHGSEDAEAVASALLSGGLVLESESGFVPSRALARITVSDAVDALWTSGAEGSDNAADMLLNAWRADSNQSAEGVASEATISSTGLSWKNSE